MEPPDLAPYLDAEFMYSIKSFRSNAGPCLAGQVAGLEWVGESRKEPLGPAMAEYMSAVLGNDQDAYDINAQWVGCIGMGYWGYGDGDKHGAGTSDVAVPRLENGEGSVFGSHGSGIGSLSGNKRGSGFGSDNYGR